MKRKITSSKTNLRISVCYFNSAKTHNVDSIKSSSKRAIDIESLVATAAIIGHRSFREFRVSKERAVESYVGLPAASRNFQQHNANIHLHPIVGHGFAAAAPRFPASGPSPVAAVLCTYDTRMREQYSRANE